MYCPNCGTKVPEDEAQFCMKCGVGLPSNMPETVIGEPVTQAHPVKSPYTPDAPGPRRSCEACGKADTFCRDQYLSVVNVRRLYKAHKIGYGRSWEAFKNEVSHRTGKWGLCPSCRRCLQTIGCDLCGARVANIDGLNPEKMRKFLGRYDLMPQNMDDYGKLDDYKNKEEFIEDVKRKNSRWMLCNECLAISRGG